jgi:hypothetical protein
MCIFILFTHTDGKVVNLDNDLFYRRHSSARRHRNDEAFVRSFVAATTTRDFVWGLSTSVCRVGRFICAS